MKLASFRSDGVDSWGLIRHDHALDVGAVLCVQWPTLRDAIAAADWDAIRQAADTAQHLPLDGLDWLPPIPRPERIICVGLNYENHRQEIGHKPAGEPTLFLRWPSSLAAHGTDLVRPRSSVQLDYEGELAVVIGKGGRHIARADAMAHVAGYSCFHDGSVRDWQRHTSQFTPGKNFPATGGFGPWIVTPDEVGPLGDIRLQTRINGAVVQEATIDQMTYPIDKLIEYCSGFTALEPGDVIVSGTPGGVGAARTPPLWLKPGDVVEIEIDRVGLLRNGVVDEG